MNWYTADTHAYHGNIIKYCDRPFASTDEINEVMITNINDRVAPDDILFHLGDWTFGPRSDRSLQIKNATDFRKQINCKNIILIQGNHDYLVHVPEFRNLFSKIHVIVETYDSIVKQKIVLCHYAMRVWNASHHGRWHLYGHSHGHLDPIDTFSFDVGVDCHNFCPINSHDVAQIMQEKYEKGTQNPADV